MEKRGDSEKRLYEHIAGRIQEMIISGELKTGDRLPSERDMARKFRVSRNSVREAIRALAESGMVESRRGDGTYLCATEPSTIVDSLARAIEQQKHRIKDIFDFRALIEPHIADLAARNISKNDLSKLKVLVCDQERKILGGEDGSDEDMAFHLLLAEIAGNRIIYDVLKALQATLLESRSEFLQTNERKRASVTAHLHLIDALEKHDPEGARDAMNRHLDSIIQTVFDDGV